MKRLESIAALPRLKTLGLASAIGVTAALGLFACTAHDLQTPDPQPEGETLLARDVNPSREVDILFVIDNSGSMKQEQDNLRKNFPAFIDELRKIDGGLPDLHIGVISSDVGAGNIRIAGNPACNIPGGDRGLLQAKPDCGLKEANARYIIAESDNPAQANFNGKLEDVFGCMANLGTEGCGFEHQLQSARVALLSTKENAGFIRKNAYLAIVFITDEDDCSADPKSDLFADTSFSGQQASLRCALNGHLCDGKNPPGAPFSSTLGKCSSDPTPSRLIAVQDFVRDISSLKDRGKIIVSAIAGWPGDAARAPNVPYTIAEDAASNLLDLEPACASANGNAVAPFRIKEFVEAFGDNGSLESICSDDFRPALQRIGKLIAVNLSPDCIRNKLVDVDPATPGLQAECLVTERKDSQSSPLELCNKDQSNKPCYELMPGVAGGCGAGTWEVKIRRNGAAPVDTREFISCRTCVDIGDPEANKNCM